MAPTTSVEAATSGDAIDEDGFDIEALSPTVAPTPTTFKEDYAMIV